MEVNRIGPDGGFIKKITQIEESIKSLRTSPAGNIVIRETLQTEDPNTGVKTIIGQLPDGSTGLKEWVGDIVPPDKPSTPIVSVYLAVISVYWDGVGFLGELNPPDYDRTDIEMSSTALGPWFKVGELRGEGSVQVTDQTVGEERFFRLVSYDKPGNASIPSDIASGIATAVVADQTIIDTIDRIDADVAANGQSITDLANETSTYPALIDQAANSLVTDARLPDGGLTKWPFVNGTIPAGALEPGAVQGSDIADFSLAVTKLQSNRHHIY